MTAARGCCFVGRRERRVEWFPWGRHDWLCRPGIARTDKIICVRVDMPGGEAHQFHRHPRREEILYVLEGRLEQWVGRKKRVLGPGDLVFIPENVVHGCYNIFRKRVRFLAVLSPAKAPGPMLVDVFRDKPWCALKTPRDYPR